MFLKQIKDFDKKSGEADVIVSDGQYELICYCHPLENTKLGTIVTEISTLFADDIMRTEDNEYFIRKETDYYSYYLHGKVLKTQTPLIAIGEITIKLDKPLAKDIKQGEFIEFRVARLNCIIK
ncbi:MAG: hypothetical protein LBR37_00275 [Erysipelotrichaceae bacterium]|jgi:hypothetical protein|nr:hypothetical protein [Erysipelotrichaceae bacterium]